MQHGFRAAHKNGSWDNKEEDRGNPPASPFAFEWLGWGYRQLTESEEWDDDGNQNSVDHYRNSSGRRCRHGDRQRECLLQRGTIFPIRATRGILVIHSGLFFVVRTYALYCIIPVILKTFA